MTDTTERGLYAPVKAFLEGQGLEVKGEVGGCDLVAVRAGEPPVVVIGELKLGFTLELVLQGVDRLAACDEVWLAVRASKRGKGREADGRVRKLCRLLGFGLLVVDHADRVHALAEPGPWVPRRDAKRRSRLLAEHQRRQGDPNQGGLTRTKLMTAYRQQALACARAMAETPRRPRELKEAAPDAAKILQNNVYGWFERVERGVYALTDAGRKALEEWA
ncbi:MAG TPA: DUF2161 family putative PD-(D/E)XK-type phosphodiesterase [Azospirillaceae bacterium]|nr:DUF2161 family putative PD-(D/E)XK-type phosphodiesterase [Azospirillaceae bacterium]